MRSLFRVSVLAVGMFLVAGCGNKALVLIPTGDGGLVLMAVQGMIFWPQAVPPEGGQSLAQPSGANLGDLDSAFSLRDGGDDQFDDALVLAFGDTDFPGQSYTESTFYAPAITGVDGLVAAVVADGTCRPTISGKLHRCSGDSLFRPDLPNGGFNLGGCPGDAQLESVLVPRPPRTPGRRASALPASHGECHRRILAGDGI